MDERWAELKKERVVREKVEAKAKAEARKTKAEAKAKAYENRSLYSRRADRRLKAAKTLGIDYLYDLTRWSAMPAEILSFIKKTHAKKYHPDTGGSKEAYQAFEENLKILGEINE